MPHNLLCYLLLLLLYVLVHLGLKDEVISNDLVFTVFLHRLFLCFHLFDLLNFLETVPRILLKVIIVSLLFVTLLLNQIYILCLDIQYLLAFYQYHLLKLFFYINSKVKLNLQVFVYLKFLKLVLNLMHINIHQ